LPVKRGFPPYQRETIFGVGFQSPIALIETTGFERRPMKTPPGGSRPIIQFSI
jgi:hypothetical protein